MEISSANVGCLFRRHCRSILTPKAIGRLEKMTYTKGGFRHILLILTSSILSFKIHRSAIQKQSAVARRLIAYVGKYQQLEDPRVSKMTTRRPQKRHLVERSRSQTSMGRIWQRLRTMEKIKIPNTRRCFGIENTQLGRIRKQRINEYVRTFCFVLGIVIPPDGHRAQI